MCDHISLLLPNRPGEFRRVTRVLQENQINILGYGLTSEGNTGILHVLCSDHDFAYRALFQEYRYYCNQAPVLICPVSHDPGQLHNVLQALYDNDLNVEMAYQAVDMTGQFLQIFQLADRARTESAQELLRASGVDVLQEQPT
ncbi:MAG: hypothetical protein ACTS1Z_14710 [Parasphingopyxis sp.]|uniref:hypothetical protein n=1 Tax=Parasphingopyxis sp. TaxID=1920299 RepID=UPI003FA0D0B6